MSDEIITIQEEFELPSKGLIYSKPINPRFKLRSMTCEEEMRRLSPSDTPYKVMADIIESCIVGKKFDIPVYDLCLGDYQFLLQRLRTVTYGPEVSISTTCPVCGSHINGICDMDKLDKLDFNKDELDKLMRIDLPISKKEITIKLQTPRLLDRIQVKKNEIIKKNPGVFNDPSIVYTIMSLVDTVDGQTLSSGSLEAFVRKMPMKDVNIILQTAGKLNDMIGVENNFKHTCEVCGSEIESPFRITSEFWGPTIY